MLFYFQMYLLSKEILTQSDTWMRSVCNGYILILNNGEDLIQHASVNHIQVAPYKEGYYPPPLWNYRAYYIVLLLGSQGASSKTASTMIKLYNFRKTENLLILEPSKHHLLALTHFLFPVNSNITMLDSWSQGKFTKGANLFAKKLANLNGALLTVATFEHAPSVVYELDENNILKRRIGVDMQVIHGLAQAKNFSVKFKEVSSVEKWGFKHPNGSWDGLMREVIQETADISVCNVFNEHFRWNDVDFSYPYNFMPGCFVAPSPKAMLNWQSPTLPFTWDTWLSIGLSLMIGGILLYLVAAMSIKKESTEFKSLAYNYLYILGSLTMRSVNIVPSHIPTRVFTGFVWLCCLIISTGYSGNLVAFLSVTKTASPIDTLSQLASSGLRFGAHSFWKTQFSGSSDPAVNHIFQYLETDKDIHDLFERVDQGEFALVENKQYLEVNRDARFTYGDRATIRIVGECLIPYSISLILTKNSPLTQNLAKDLLHLFESGMMIKWQKDVVALYRKQFEHKRQLRVSREVTGTKALKLDQLQGVFYITGVGYILTAIILILEMIFKPVQ